MVKARMSAGDARRWTDHGITEGKPTSWSASTDWIPSLQRHPIAMAGWSIDRSIGLFR